MKTFSPPVKGVASPSSLNATAAASIQSDRSGSSKRSKLARLSQVPINERVFGLGLTYTGDGDPATGIRHGRGVLTRADGTVQYDGPWRDDKRHGRGITRFSDGSWFECEWTDDVPAAQGVLQTQTNVQFTGDWELVNGEPLARMLATSLSPALQPSARGRGRVRYADGAIYNGEWRHGLRNGSGDYLELVAQRATYGHWVDGRLDTTRWFTRATACGLVTMPDAFAMRGEAPRTGDEYVQSKATDIDSDEVLQGIRLQYDIGQMTHRLLSYILVLCQSLNPYSTSSLTAAFAAAILWHSRTTHSLELLKRSCDVGDEDCKDASRLSCPCINLACPHQRIVRSVYTGQLDRAGLFPRGRGVFESRWGGMTLCGDGWDDLDVKSGRATYAATGATFTGSWRAGKWDSGELQRNDGPSVANKVWDLDDLIRLSFTRINAAMSSHGRGKLTLYDGSVVDGTWADGKLLDGFTIKSPFGFIQTKSSTTMLSALMGSFSKLTKVSKPKLQRDDFYSCVTAGATSWLDSYTCSGPRPRRVCHKMTFRGECAVSSSGNGLSSIEALSETHESSSASTITLDASALTRDWRLSVDAMRGSDGPNTNMSTKTIQYSETTKRWESIYSAYEEFATKSAAARTVARTRSSSSTFKCTFVEKLNAPNKHIKPTPVISMRPSLELSVVGCFPILSSTLRPEQAMTLVMKNGNLITGVLFDVQPRRMTLLPHPEQLRMQLAHGPVFVADPPSAAARAAYPRGTAPLLGKMLFPDGSSETRRYECSSPGSTAPPLSDEFVTRHGWRLTIRREPQYRSANCRCTPFAH